MARAIVLDYLPHCLTLYNQGELIRLMDNETNLRGLSEEWNSLFNVLRSKGIGAVYFISDEKDEKVKIGYTKNLQRRYLGLVSATGQDLRITLAIPILIENMKEVEAAMHEAFGGERLKGEWFIKKDKDGDFVADIVGALLKMPVEGSKN